MQSAVDLPPCDRLHLPVVGGACSARRPGLGARAAHADLMMLARLAQALVPARALPVAA
jgi:hypothetical protein